MVNINWVDLLFVLVLLRGLYIGWIEGFATEFFKTVGVVGSFVITSLYYKHLGVLVFKVGFFSKELGNILAFLILFSLLMLIFTLLRNLLLYFVRLEAASSGFHKLAGLLLGVFRAVVFSGALVFWLNLFPVDYLKSSLTEKSFSGPYLLNLLPRTQEFFRPKQVD